MQQSEPQNTMFEIRRLRVLSVARVVTLISTVLYLITGFVVIVLYGGISRIITIGSFGSASSIMSVFLVWVAGTLGVFLVSFLTGLLIGGLYNLFAKWWGGIQVELGKSEEGKSAEKN